MEHRQLLHESRDYFDDGMRETLDALHPRVKVAMALFLLESTVMDGIGYEHFESAQFADHKINTATNALRKITGQIG